MNNSLIKEIICIYKKKVIICGTNSEADLIKNIVKDINSKLILLRIGKSLLEYIEIIRNAEVLIGNNSSSVHIASFVKTKSICIYGGQLYGRFLPYPEWINNRPLVIFNNQCKENDWECANFHNCLNQIGVQEVISKLDYLLNL